MGQHAANGVVRQPEFAEDLADDISEVQDHAAAAAARRGGDNEHARRGIAEGQAGDPGRGHNAGRIDRRADHASDLRDGPLHVVDQGQPPQRA